MKIEPTFSLACACLAFELILTSLEKISDVHCLTPVAVLIRLTIKYDFWVRVSCLNGSLCYAELGSSHHATTVPIPSTRALQTYPKVLTGVMS